MAIPLERILMSKLVGKQKKGKVLSTVYALWTESHSMLSRF
jgi:hypothetical protein